MGAWKRKTQIYMLVVSLIMSLLTIAVMRSSPVKPDKTMTPSQQIDALQKVDGQSPEMSRFLKHQKDALDANQQAADAMPR